jgi:hypothetical protein
VIPRVFHQKQRLSGCPAKFGPVGRPGNRV